MIDYHEHYEHIIGTIRLYDHDRDFYAIAFSVENIASNEKHTKTTPIPSDQFFFFSSDRNNRFSISSRIRATGRIGEAVPFSEDDRENPT